MFGELIFGERNLFFDVKQFFICLLIIDMCKKRTGEMNEQIVVDFFYVFRASISKLYV